MGNTTSAADITSLKTSIAAINTKIKALQTTTANQGVANIDYDKLATSMGNQTNNINSLSTAMLNSPDKLAASLVSKISSDTMNNSIQAALSKNDVLVNSVSGKLTSDNTYKSLLKGEKGDPGNMGGYEAVKSNLFTGKLGNAKHPATLWCADSELCQAPDGNTGIAIGDLHKGSRLHLSSDADIFLLPKKGNVEVSSAWGGSGNLKLDGALTLGNGWSITTDGDGLKFRVNGEEKAAIYRDGAISGSRVYFGNGYNLRGDADVLRILHGNNEVGYLQLISGRANLNLSGNFYSQQYQKWM